MPYTAYIQPSKRFNRIVSIFLTINLRFAIERKFHFIKCFAYISRTFWVRNRYFSIFWSTMPYTAYIQPSKRFNRIVSIFLTINLRFAIERKFHFIKCFAYISRTFWVRNRYFSTFWSTLPYIVCMQSSKRFNIIVSIFLATNLRFAIERKFHFIKYFAYISQEIFTRNSHQSIH